MEQLIAYLNATPALLLAFILALGIAAQWLAWYLKQPSILFLLILGLLIGPVSGILQPDKLLGDLLFPFISLGVAIILFEGSLTLQFHEIKQHGSVVNRLVTIGPLITIVVIAAAAHWMMNLSVQISLLLGALVCVTGPTVIAPLLKSVRPNKAIRNVLRWEGIIIDPIGAIAVVLIYQYIITGGEDSSMLLFGKIVLTASVLGLIGAFVLANLIIRHWMPDYLRNVFTLAYVLLLFTLSNAIEHESGLLTVTILGVALANWPKFPRDHILEFNESLTILLISVLFIVLAARVDLNALMGVGAGGVLVLLVVMLIARPLAVFICAHNSILTLNEKLMISWIGPRGIVAAAISSLFAIKLQSYHIEGYDKLVPLVFLIIIGTVLIQGMGAKLVGSLLGVREPVNNGVLIIGSNPVALAVAESLNKEGFDVVVADSHYTNLSKIRMAGIRTYYGNPVSEDAERNLDLIGIGHLFAMSVDKELNTLSELYYKHEFGSQHIYRLQLSAEQNASERNQKQHQFSSRLLFGDTVTYSRLASMLSRNARIKTTNLTDNYTYEQFLADNPQAIPMLTIDKKNNLHIITQQTKSKDLQEVKLLSLVEPLQEEN
ncbi:cation:proton antiporter [Pelistega europaea]|uniref:Sodium:proton antiporter n=1 Tax=Pelistega europaea TaxID=106147 RepID=A0A7Y4L9D4_9BURK|nr:sodium:proton antiporter [Pelistega europaea]NOL49344.1 sodium:proton antiporter [Pelistega europaea]